MIMSGLAEIIEWTNNEIPKEEWKQYDNAEEAYNSINQNFTDDNRLPLDKILGDDKDKYMKYLQEKIDKFKPKPVQEFKTITISARSHYRTSTKGLRYLVRAYSYIRKL